MIARQLLYDRLLQTVHRCASPLDELELNIGGALIDLPVYELSEVAQLFRDHPLLDDHPIPKRPPHDRLWAEWEYCDDDNNEWTIGVLYVQHPNPESFKRTFPRSRISDESKTYIDLATDIYGGRFFRRVNANKTLGNNFTNDTVYFEQLTSYALFHDEYVKLRHVAGVPAALQHPFGLNGICTEPKLLKAEPLLGSLWPLEMCFGLLACRNVETHSVEPKRDRVKGAKRARMPRPATYRTIRLTRPVRSSSESVPGTSDLAAKKRFHLVRGHFKNLQSDRYLQKGWHWWPDHWRGDETLGVSPIRYKVTQ
jgi:hypothetical protein